MFEDMRHSSGVGRICLESDAEDIVGIISCNVQVLGTRFIVGELEGGQF